MAEVVVFRFAWTSTAPVVCTTNEDCSEIYRSECRGTTCQCVYGYVITVYGYDVTAGAWRRGCRLRQLYEDVPGCRDTWECVVAVPGSYCEALSGQCLCLQGFLAGRTLNASCARISAPTCRSDVDCYDAISHSHCDVGGRCQCDVRRADDGSGTACVLRPIGGFCRETADCAGAVPDSQCGADHRCRCISGFHADGDSVCVRRRVGSACHMTSHCGDAFTGSECVHGACACRPEYRVVSNGRSCRRRRIDDEDDTACDKHSDYCEVIFTNSVCGEAGLCVCLSGHRPGDQYFNCVRRQHLTDRSPCRNDQDCSDAIPNSFCDWNHHCACPTGYRPDNITTSAGNGNVSDTCRRRVVGDQCFTDAECSAILSATCSQAGFCACVTGYGIPTGGGVDCRRRRIGGVVGCAADRDCLEGIVFSVCRRSSCACLPGYMDVNSATTCVRRKIHTHSHIDQCLASQTDIIYTVSHKKETLYSCPYLSKY